MNRLIVRPEALDLDSPGRRDYWLALEHDSVWGDHLMPLTVWVGPETKSDEGLVSFGSTHGNEFEGPVALKHLLGEIKMEDVRGRIILIPVLNPPAFRQGTRESMTEDRVNLNRAFVDGAGREPALAGITYRIAAFVREHIWPRVNVVLDLHSGGFNRFALCTSYHPVEDPEQTRLIEKTARWFGTPLVMTYQNETPGLLTSEAERLGKITVGTELGWASSVNSDGVRFARQGVRAAAIHHGFLKGEIEPIGAYADGTQQRVAMVDRDCFCVAPFSGHFEPVRNCGDTVSKGEIVAYLHSFEHIDSAPHAIIAQVDGVIISQWFIAPVTQGQHAVVIGKVEEWAE